MRYAAFAPPSHFWTNAWTRAREIASHTRVRTRHTGKAYSKPPFDMAALQAEALWGKEAQSRTLRLRMCVKLLHVAKDSYLADKCQNGRIFRVDPDLGSVTRDALAGAVSEDTNRLSTEISFAVRDIERMLESHSHGSVPEAGHPHPLVIRNFVPRI